MAHSYAKLRRLSREELIELHDMEAAFAQSGVSYYLDEIWRRDTEEQTKTMVSLTKRMGWIAALILVLTATNVVAVLITLFK
jgi:hypothetical protein